MGFFRYRLLVVIIVCCFYVTVKAQTIYYPTYSSSLLKSTADDVAMLFRKSSNSETIIQQAYTTIPSTGIIFIYDRSITDNQACKVESDGKNFLKFTAAEDNGLNFGIYQYLHLIGFRFYQPGSIWEIIPTLSSPYKKADTVFTCGLKYKTWFISGGHNLWAMDTDNTYPWDSYFGANGHQWALYQRRNGMLGGYRFAGHRGELMSGDYLATLQNNPCYVACFDSSRKATTQSVPDIHNNAAMQLWGQTIGNDYTQFKNIIFGDTSIYEDYYRNFNYNHGYIGIEVPDGAHWANTTDNTGCSNAPYSSGSDQQFTLANYVTANVSAVNPDKRMQAYAYDRHADIPSSSIVINNKIDVQVVPTAFQFETSDKGLLNRWYNRYNNISEYQYLNLPAWGGETPTFFLNDLKSTVARVKQKNSQGVLWEASPAKFASLPFLLAANNYLKDNTPVDTTLSEFCNSFFSGASGTIYTLLQLWSDDKTIAVGDCMQDNKYKMPLYVQLLNQATTQTQNAPAIVKQRISELKAYLHYMILYYYWIFDQRSAIAKADKAAALCMYLAKTNKLQIVNSYYLIATIVNGYAQTDNFYRMYNVDNGTAYQNGKLALITADEINNNFLSDIAIENTLVTQYSFKSAAEITGQFSKNNLIPLSKINVNIGYTNGSDYTNRSEFYINAPSAGSFTIQYTPTFNMTGKGYINFTVEAVGQSLQVIKDYSINQTDGGGSFSIVLPTAGTYKLSVVSKYKSSVKLSIAANGNYFYRNGPFLGNTVENYRTDLLSLPGRFYVPENISKIYFSINNSNPGGAGFASPNDISKAFVFKDNSGDTLQPYLVSPKDSALFYLDVPAGSGGIFLQAFKMEQYRLCFANISNLEWYAQPKPCPGSSFSISSIKSNDNCFTQLVLSDSTISSSQWQVYDAGQSYIYSNQIKVSLPDYISPNAIVTLTTAVGCSVSKRLADDAVYMQQKQNCASGGALPVVQKSPAPMLYPNPGNGIYNCMLNGSASKADEIIFNNVQGQPVADFKNIAQFNISQFPAGIYFYQLKINGVLSRGKVIKQ